MIEDKIRRMTLKTPLELNWENFNVLKKIFAKFNYMFAHILIYFYENVRLRFTFQNIVPMWHYTSLVS